VIYVRVAVVITLLLFVAPLATPAGPTYWQMLATKRSLVTEAAIGLALAMTWTLRRTAELLFLRASGRRLRASTQR
jgi:hypothetical protein